MKSILNVYIIFIFVVLCLVIPVSATNDQFNLSVLDDNTWYIINYTPSEALQSYSVLSDVNLNNTMWRIYGTNDDISYYVLANVSNKTFFSGVNQLWDNTCTLTSFAKYYLDIVWGFESMGSNITIIFNPNILNTNFTATPTSGVKPQTIQFNDTTTGTPTAWNWSFGDGTYSTAQNPSHTYTEVGVYTVMLTTANTYDIDIHTKIDYIHITLGNILVDFIGVPTSQLYPDATVSFTSYTYNQVPTDYNWSFGDGVFSSDINPSYTYLSPGIYTVTLAAANGSAFNATTKTNYIMIQDTIRSNFSVTPNIGYIYIGSSGSVTYPLIYFTDLSIGSTAWNWSFGDGNYSALQNPVHQYVNNGTYDITLTVTNIYGLDNTSTQNGAVNIFISNIFNIKSDMGTDWIKWWWYTSDPYNLMIDGRWVTLSRSNISTDGMGDIQKTTNTTKYITSGSYILTGLEPNTPHTIQLYQIGNASNPLSTSTVKTLPHAITIYILLISTIILLVVSIIIMYRSKLFAIFLCILILSMGLYGSSLSYGTNGLIYIFFGVVVMSLMIIAYILYRTYYDDMS